MPFAALGLSLEPSDRAALHKRIAGRFRAMLAAGLVAELEELRRRHSLDERMPSMRAVGYRQAWDTLEGRASAATLEARGIAATRQLAKRQLTWLRGAAPSGTASKTTWSVSIACGRTWPRPQASAWSASSRLSLRRET